MTRLTGAELDRALETIATNAIVAAQIVYERGNKPWIYNDTQRREMIAKILHLDVVQAEPAGGDHYNIVSLEQPAKHPGIDAALASLEADLIETPRSETSTNLF